MSSHLKDHLIAFHEYGVYVPNRIIDLSGEIDELEASKFIRNIRILDHTSEKDITVLINTPGGDVHHGLAIVDAIKECRSKVITHAVGPCWSMGACILVSGDERKISRNATVMIHAGEMGIDPDHPRNVDRWIKEFTRVGDIYDTLILQAIQKKKPRFQKKKLKDIMVFDTIYQADQVIGMGLADIIEEYKEF